MSYKLTSDPSVVRSPNNAYVPVSGENIEGRKYLAWLDEGNTPEPEFTQSELDVQAGATEQEWCRAELAVADIQIAYLIDGDTRQSPPPSDWYTYRKDLRNRVTGGVIIGDPTPTGRPTRPEVT